MQVKTQYKSGDGRMIDLWTTDKGNMIYGSQGYEILMDGSEDSYLVNSLEAGLNELGWDINKPIKFE